MFGILFNGITYLLTPSTGAPGESFFSDMALIHFMIVMAYASLGLVTSAIIKFSGSITKVYASSMSMFFAALVSWLLLNDQLTVLFFVGCLGCCFALHLYYRVPATSPSDSAVENHHEEEEDDSDIDDQKTGVRHAAPEQRRDSSSSSTSSTTLTTSSVSKAKANKGGLTSIKVVDSNEYFSLDRFDDNDDNDSNCKPSPR
jgi:hypothetical protein